MHAVTHRSTATPEESCSDSLQYVLELVQLQDLKEGKRLWPLGHLDMLEMDLVKPISFNVHRFLTSASRQLRETKR